MSAALSFSGSITKGGRTIAQATEFSLPSVGLVCLVGPSGAGKSTLARSIALLEPDASGAIESPSGRIDLPAPRGWSRPRDLVTYVSQDAYLWPHLTLAQATQLVLTDHGRTPALTSQMSMQLGVADLESRYPATLSGGERQRAAVILGFAPEPQFAVLDEVTSNLDTGNRRRLVDLVAEQSKVRGVLLVTHDLPVVEYLLRRVAGARFAYMTNGQIAAEGRAAEWRAPTSESLREFIATATLSDEGVA